MITFLFTNFKLKGIYIKVPFCFKSESEENLIEKFYYSDSDRESIYFLMLKLIINIKNQLMTLENLIIINTDCRCFDKFYRPGGWINNIIILKLYLQFIDISFDRIIRVSKENKLKLLIYDSVPYYNIRKFDSLESVDYIRKYNSLYPNYLEVPGSQKFSDVLFRIFDTDNLHKLLKK